MKIIKKWKNDPIKIKSIKIKRYKKRFKEYENKILKELINDKMWENKKGVLIEKQKFNWFEYIWHKSICGKKKPYISYYEGYRKKILSEEDIFRGSLDIYNLFQFLKFEEDKDINGIKGNNSNKNII